MAMYGQCPHCKGSLTAGHKCPAERIQQPEAEEVQEELRPPKLARMVRLWAATTDIEQRQIAEEIGCSTSTLSRFLSGHAVPDGRTMVRIMQWLMVP